MGDEYSMDFGLATTPHWRHMTLWEKCRCVAFYTALFLAFASLGGVLVAMAIAVLRSLFA